MGKSRIIWSFYMQTRPISRNRMRTPCRLTFLQKKFVTYSHAHRRSLGRPRRYTSRGFKNERKSCRCWKKPWRLSRWDPIKGNTAAACSPFRPQVSQCQGEAQWLISLSMRKLKIRDWAFRILVRNQFCLRGSERQRISEFHILIISPWNIPYLL